MSRRPLNIRTRLTILHLVALPDSVVLEGELVFSDNGARVFVADVRDDVKFRRPKFELSLPVDERGQRDGDEEGASAVTLLVERVQERNRLYSLTQTHFIGKDDVGAALPAVAGPVQTFELKRMRRQVSRTVVNLSAVFLGVVAPSKDLHQRMIIIAFL
jgi:hypothetical protein